MDRMITPHNIKTAIPWAETCFGCNDGLSEGIGMRTYITEDGYVVGVCEAKETHQGLPGFIHGGIVGTYFDEVLWHATRLQNPNLVAMTLEMDVHYYKPVRPGMKIRIVAGPARVEGRHVHVDGYLLLPNDEVGGTAYLHYLEVRKEHELTENEPVREKHAENVRTDVKAICF